MMPLLSQPPLDAEERLWSLRLVLPGHFPEVTPGQVGRPTSMASWGLSPSPQFDDFLVLIEKKSGFHKAEIPKPFYT